MESMDSTTTFLVVFTVVVTAIATYTWTDLFRSSRQAKAERLGQRFTAVTEQLERVLQLEVRRVERQAKFDDEQLERKIDSLERQIRSVRDRDPMMSRN